jgi:hypothetical protein
MPPSAPIVGCSSGLGITLPQFNLSAHHSEPPRTWFNDADLGNLPSDHPTETWRWHFSCIANE